MQVLGGCCQECRSCQDLQFHVKTPDGQHHSLDTSARVSYYWRQYGLNNLGLLCRKCHQRLHSEHKECQHKQDQHLTGRDPQKRR